MSDLNNSVAASALSAATQAITIQGHDFEVPAPFVAGYSLNPNEAAAMNQLFAENVRNNAAGKIKAVAKELDKDPSELDLDNTMIGEGESAISLRQSIVGYAAEYKFGERKARSAAEPVDPTERAAFRIANETVRAALKEQGIAVKNLAEGQLDALVAQLAAEPEIVAEAKRQVKAREKIGAGALDFSSLKGSAPAEQASA